MTCIVTSFAFQALTYLLFILLCKVWWNKDKVMMSLFVSCTFHRYCQSLETTQKWNCHVGKKIFLKFLDTSKAVACLRKTNLSVFLMLWITWLKKKIILPHFPRKEVTSLTSLKDRFVLRAKLELLIDLLRHLIICKNYATCRQLFLLSRKNERYL